MDKGEKLEKEIEKGISQIESNLGKIKELETMLEKVKQMKEEVL